MEWNWPVADVTLPVYNHGNLTAAECIRQAVDGVRTLTANRKGATVPKNRCAFSLNAYPFVAF
jgi:cell division FtsZ-interacting protein ZapD